jgi:hypothetical protein
MCIILWQYYNDDATTTTTTVYFVVKLLIQCTEAVGVATLYIMRYVSVLLKFTDYDGISSSNSDWTIQIKCRKDTGVYKNVL